jgi:hypothetical protein
MVIGPSLTAGPSEAACPVWQAGNARAKITITNPNQFLFLSRE